MGQPVFGCLFLRVDQDNLMELKLYQPYQAKRGDNKWAIYFMLTSKISWVYKYGKNEAVESGAMNFYTKTSLTDVSPGEPAPEEIHLDDPGMRGIPERVIQDIFEDR